MEPVYKISAGNKISIKDNILFVKDLTGNVGDVDYVENPDNPDTFTARTNTTGYSAESRLRGDMALFLFAYIRTTKGDLDLVIKPYDPVLVTTWEIEFAKDGWYVFELFATPVLKEEDMLLEGVLRYDTAIKEVVLIEGGVATAVDIRKTTILRVTESDKPVLLDAVRSKIRLNNEVNLIHFSGDTTGHRVKTLIDDYNNLRLLIEHAYGEFVQGNKYVFQRSAEYITSNCCR